MPSPSPPLCGEQAGPGALPSEGAWRRRLLAPAVMHDTEPCNPGRDRSCCLGPGAVAAARASLHVPASVRLDQNAPFAVANTSAVSHESSSDATHFGRWCYRMSRGISASTDIFTFEEVEEAACQVASITRSRWVPLPPAGSVVRGRSVSAGCAGSGVARLRRYVRRRAAFRPHAACSSLLL